MDKKQFMSLLKLKLRRFSATDIEETLSYYDELIYEKMQEGLSEKDAVASLGNPQEVASNMAVDMVAKSKTTGVNAALILLGALSTPILLPILVVIAVLYFVVFVVWGALVFGFGVATVASLVASLVSLFTPGELASKLFATGGGLITFVVCGAVCYVVVKYGLMLLNLMTVKLAKKVFNRRQER